MKHVSFKYKGKKISTDVEVCGFFGKIFGLMFKSREGANALLFDFKKPTRISIHSFFVFFPFIAVWLDKKGKVLEIKKITPFASPVSPKKNFHKLIEIPSNTRYNGKIKLLYP